MQERLPRDLRRRRSGASCAGSLWTILVPMLVPALLASALFTMILAFRELQSTLYLAGPDTRTAAVVMFDLVGEKGPSPPWRRSA